MSVFHIWQQQQGNTVLYNLYYENVFDRWLSFIMNIYSKVKSHGVCPEFSCIKMQYVRTKFLQWWTDSMWVAVLYAVLVLLLLSCTNIWRLNIRNTNGFIILFTGASTCKKMKISFGGMNSNALSTCATLIGVQLTMYTEIK